MSNGNGNGHTAIWRWIIGIIIVVQMSLMGWQSQQIEELDDKVDSYRAESNVSLLNERVSYFAPIIRENSIKINELDKEISVMRGVDKEQDKRIDRLEGRRP